ncbi:MAG: polymerase primary sigma factor [Fibrobacteres bacterium]|nr:polymerase primary sigma factor [Fibrobacterota bacterium]
MDQRDSSREESTMPEAEGIPGGASGNGLGVKKRQAPVKKEKIKASDRSLKFLGDDSGLAAYLREISQNTNLSLQQEAELARRIRTGDKEALNTLVQANLKFVVAVCRNYQYQGLPLGDLINEGNLGLIRAAKRFDETMNFKFISYAVWWIRQAILSSLADQSRVINIPPSRVGTIHKMGKTSVKLEQKLGRAPTVSELAEEMGVGINEIHESLQLSASPMSLDAPVKDGEDGRLEDVLEDHNVESPDKSTTAFSLREEMKDILSSLDDREEKVVRLYYGIGLETTYTLEEIAQRFNLTRERVRQIKEKALKRLRHPSRMQKLERFKA